MVARLFSRYTLLLLTALLIASCASDYPSMTSKNRSERIKTLVMHFTAIDYEKSVHALVDEGGLSAHYLVTDPFDPSNPSAEAKAISLVPEDKRAWHAGVSYWQTRSHLNDTSIGIEIVNVPKCEHDTTTGQAASEHGANRLCFFPDYPTAQINVLIALAKDILARNPDIHPTGVIGHSDIAFDRKNDPGPRFPWFELYQAGIGAWYDNETRIRYWKTFNQQLPNIGLMQAALREYGYGVIETGIFDSPTKNALYAFQMHFVQDNVSGQLNSETAAALFALIEKYFPAKGEKLMARYKKETALTHTTATKTPSIGQIAQVFPSQNRSSRKDVNDKAAFKSYKGRGEIILKAEQDTRATIQVNGQTLNIATPLLAGKTYHYSLKKRTKDGVNTLSVKDVSPAQNTVNITVPWPALVDNTQAWQQRFSQVDALINEEIDNGFPGAALLVIKDGQIIKREAYGYALRYDANGTALPSQSPMTTSTLFDLASNTKVMATTMAIMKLVSEGKINVDAPLYQYLPEYRDNGREARTVRDLLSHQSGYGSEVRFFKPDNPYGPALMSREKNRTNRLLATKVPFKEGNKLEAKYSDTNFMLLGYLVERVSGMSLDRYCEQELYAPLQLNHTVFNPLKKGFRPDQIAATEINGNTRNGHVAFPGIRTYTLQGEVHDEKAWYSMQGVSGHAGLFSNIDDIGVLLQTLLNGGGYNNVSLFDDQTLALFTGPSSLDPGFGLGWRRAADGRNSWHFGPYASHTAFGHTGWTGTATVIDPTLDLAIVLLTNARHTPVVESSTGNLEFTGKKQFETGNYGSVITRIYAAVLQNN
ncbi:penicillin binding protein PBP4B [Alteromonas sp. C1M14]|uniref:penicillin binding protein PBP4B n=1 Tax=Alteromonas sp. C1M14 TaxID=2841567 RepID=UPI001C094601|nr:penicillin binding protein PBP4B [Alteromonas sp. C1M14]MBU2978711.1 penicillin binding protein PBP4B [Alteromonas sp. C1M14]